MTINGMLGALLSAIKVPSLVVGTIVVLGFIASAMGFGITTPGSEISQINRRMEHVEMRVDALVRGHCVEWDRETLELSGLITECRELGIVKD
jgi:hypothetical protein